MIAKLIIQCDTYAELLQHLNVIKQQIKKEFEKQIKTRDVYEDGSDAATFEIFDDNCYGSHKGKIIIV